MKKSKMAHLQPYSPSIVKGLHKEISWRCRVANHSLIGSITGRKTWENSNQSVNISSWRKLSGRDQRRLVQLLHCCSTSPSSSAEELEVIAENVDAEESRNRGRNKKDQFSFLLDEHGWQVRRMAEREDEMRTVARVQAEAFHEPAILLDDLFFQFFQAEVLSGLLYRLKNSPPDRYACLVAEPSSNASNPEIQDLVGVVDVTVLRDADVLQYLMGADEYLYVSGIAVLRKFRRQKVATALLKACEMLAAIWGFKYLVLRAYEDDWGARKLYSNAGYRVVGGDPAWMTTWIGRRRRVLMVKMCNTYKNS